MQKKESHLFCQNSFSLNVIFQFSYWRLCPLHPCLWWGAYFGIVPLPYHTLPLKEMGRREVSSTSATLRNNFLTQQTILSIHWICR